MQLVACPSVDRRGAFASRRHVPGGSLSPSSARQCLSVRKCNRVEIKCKASPRSSFSSDEFPRDGEISSSSMPKDMIDVNLDNSNKGSNVNENASVKSNNRWLLAAAAVPFPCVAALIPSWFGGDGGCGKGGNGGDGWDGGSPGGDGSPEFNEIAVLADGSDSSESDDLTDASDNDEYDNEDEDNLEDENEDEEDLSGEDEQEEEDAGEMDASGGFYCSEIKAQGLPVGEGIPTEDDLFAALNCQPGFQCTRAELSQDIKQLYSTGLFESVNARVLPGKKGKFNVVFDFVEKLYPEIQSFKVEGTRVLPPSVVSSVHSRLKDFKGQPFTMQTMAAIKNIVEGWYQSRGFGLSYISHFTGMPTGEIVAHVVEGRTSKVGVVHVDEDGNPTKSSGSIPSSFILKHCPVEVGTLYNLNDGRKCLQNVFSLDLFDNVQVFPRQNEKDPSRVEVDIMVREKPVQTADVEMEWQVAPNDSGAPSLVSLVPGGTITYEHRNLGGKAATVAASINTKNFLSPADDLSYRFVFSQPYLHGLDDPKKTRLSATVFNARKLCGVFTPGPSGEDVPSVWVDRMGAKVALEEHYSRGSKGSLALVAQEVVTRDENGAPCNRGMRATPFGQYIADGPPTTLGGSGKDYMVYAQGSLIRDTTYPVNGESVGARDIYSVSSFTIPLNLCW